jgi:hypothetical protein
MLYIILRGRWCSIIVLNVQCPCKDERDDIQDSFCEELGHVFDRFPRYGVTVLLSVFNAEVGREDIFKLTVRIESSHEISNDSGIRVVNFASSKT